jgi:hypothetical protein
MLRGVRNPLDPPACGAPATTAPRSNHHLRARRDLRRGVQLVADGVSVPVLRLQRVDVLA